MAKKLTMTWENPLSTPGGSVLPLSLHLTVFNNQNYFNLRVDKQLDSTSNQLSPSAPWPWPWLPTGVLPMGKLVLLLGNPSKKRAASSSQAARVMLLMGGGRAARHPASHRACHRDRSAIPRAILQTSLSKSATGMWRNSQGLSKEVPKRW